MGSTITPCLSLCPSSLLLLQEIKPLTCSLLAHRNDRYAHAAVLYHQTHRPQHNPLLITGPLHSNALADRSLLLPARYTLCPGVQHIIIRLRPSHLHRPTYILRLIVVAITACCVDNSLVTISPRRLTMPNVVTSSSIILSPMAPPPSMHIQSPLASPTSAANKTSAQSPRQVFNQTPFLFAPNGPPPPGARAPMIRRSSRFDPLETTTEEDTQSDLARQPPRRIREEGPERKGSEGSVSLPGIKALLNAADQPSLVSPFANSFSSPSIHSSTSPLDSPNSRTSRFSSFASSSGDGPGWWAPDERSSSFSGGYPSSRSGSFSRGPLDDEPEVKRRRSDMAPTLPDADEVARLKWQAQSRNASFPAPATMGSGSGLRAMLYPPMSASSSMSRGSFSGTPLGSPLSPPVESPRDYSSSRGSPMTGPLARSFAELTASERSNGDAHGPSRNRSPVERRPSLFLQPALSSESVPGLAPRRDSVPHPPSSSAEAPQRLSMTRPPSPEPSSQPRRSSLAELIKASSGDDIALAKGFFQPSPAGPNATSHADPRPPPWMTRRESTESIHSASSVPGPQDDRAGPRDRRNAAIAPLTEVRRADDDDAVSKDDPMHGMEVLAESARRVSNAERRDSDDREGSPTKGGAGTGPKYTCQFCAKTFSRPSSLRIHTYSREYFPAVLSNRRYRRTAIYV